MKEKRGAKRRLVTIEAWIAVSASVHFEKCLIINISDTGARLEVRDTDCVPNTFTLLLSRTGAIYRNCRVIWRDKLQIGVTFDRSVLNSGIQYLLQTSAVTTRNIAESDTKTVDLDDPIIDRLERSQ